MIKIIITIVPSYTGKNITRLLPLALLLVLRTRNNTDGNKLVIFSGIALYYGDTSLSNRTVDPIRHMEKQEMKWKLEMEIGNRTGNK